MYSKKRSKKAAWGLAMTASLILALIFTGIGLQMVKRISKEISYGFDKGLCKESVIMNAKFRLPYEEAERFELMCPTRYVTIDVNKITFETVENKKEITIRCGRLDDDRSRKCFFDFINPIIADLIFDCWDQFAAGQLSVFSKYEEDRQCIICSRIEFTPDVQNAIHAVDADWWSGFDKETSLEEYMATHRPKTVMKGPEEHQITYLEFTLDPTDAFGRDPYEYKISEPMAVVFIAINEYNPKVLVGAVWEGIRTYLLSDDRQPKEAPRFVNKLDFIPYSTMRRECEVLR